MIVRDDAQLQSWSLCTVAEKWDHDANTLANMWCAVSLWNTLSHAVLVYYQCWLLLKLFVESNSAHGLLLVNCFCMRKIVVRFISQCLLVPVVTVDAVGLQDLMC
jgi:hypothetical protein